jgi:hypothetical protein
MGLVKAKLKVEGGTEFEVQFNPSEYNISEGASYADKTIPGLDGPLTQYIAGTAPTLNMTLIFDTYKPPQMVGTTADFFLEGGTDVSKETKKVIELVALKGDLHRPPKVTFSWGSLSFEGVITDVRQSYTMFLSDGKPVRAKLDVTFKSIYDINKQTRKSPFESPDRTKFRTIHEGEQLWNFAYQEYGSPEMWRVIAKENGIMNPLDIYPGQIIKLPAL